MPKQGRLARLIRDKAPRSIRLVKPFRGAATRLTTEGRLCIANVTATLDALDTISLPIAT